MLGLLTLPSPPKGQAAFSWLVKGTGWGATPFSSSEETRLNEGRSRGHPATRSQDVNQALRGGGPISLHRAPPPALTGTGCGWQEPGWTLRGRQLVGMGRDAVSVGQDGGFLESRCQFSGLAGAKGQGAGQTPLPPRPPTRPGILESQRL